MQTQTVKSPNLYRRFMAARERWMQDLAWAKGLAKTYPNYTYPKPKASGGMWNPLTEIPNPEPKDITVDFCCWLQREFDRIVAEVKEYGHVIIIKEESNERANSAASTSTENL